MKLLCCLPLALAAAPAFAVGAHPGWSDSKQAIERYQAAGNKFVAAR